MIRYLGDSVYAKFNDVGQLMLYTDNGYGPNQVIYLEPEVYTELSRFVEHENSPWRVG